MKIADFEKIGFGGSCFWCTEAIFQSLIGVEEVLQGWISSAQDYSNFSEAVLISYNPNLISLETLIEIHLHTHSCTNNHSMREKYRSAIYYFNDSQRYKSKEALKRFQKDFEKPIITLTIPYIDFKINQTEFLDYYYRNIEKPFCENIINPKQKLVLKRFNKNADAKKLAHLISKV